WTAAATPRPGPAWPPSPPPSACRRRRQRRSRPASAAGTDCRRPASPIGARAPQELSINPSRDVGHRQLLTLSGGDVPVPPQPASWLSLPPPRAHRADDLL